MNLTYLLLLLAVSATAVAGNTMFKLGATHDPEDDPVAIGHLHRTLFKPVIIGGMFSYAVSQLLWITLLRISDLSWAYPLSIGLNFTLIMTVAWVHFREPLSWGRLAGVVLIFGGIVMVATA